MLNRRSLILGASTLATAAALPPLMTVSAQNDGTPIDVVTTVGMIADFAQTIGGDAFSVTALMGPGVDPHLYSPTAGDTRRMGNADLILYGGLHLEGRMVDVLERFADTAGTAHAVFENFPEDQLLITDKATNAYDPHVWFDVSLWRLVVQRGTEVMLDALGRQDETILQAAADYQTMLDELDTFVMEQAHTLPDDRRVLVTAHDAFNYFGRRYDFEVMGLQGVSTATEASVADVQALADMLVEREIPAIFVESSVPKRTIESVQEAARAQGWEVSIGGELYSDAMGDEGTPDGTYNGMVRHNITTIVSALQG